MQLSRRNAAPSDEFLASIFSTTTITTKTTIVKRRLQVEPDIPAAKRPKVHVKSVSTVSTSLQRSEKQSRKRQEIQDGEVVTKNKKQKPDVLVNNKPEKEEQHVHKPAELEAEIEQYIDKVPAVSKPLAEDEEDEQEKKEEEAYSETDEETNDEDYVELPISPTKCKKTSRIPGSPKPVYEIDKSKYQVILADPPWFYCNQGVKGNCKDQYPMLKDKELYNLDIIKKVSDPTHCALLLWCTGPKLDVGIRLLREWGFNFKTVFLTWCKVDQTGKASPRLGYYTRSCTEFCLLGTRGRVLQWKNSNTVSQALVEPEEEELHSDDDQVVSPTIFAPRRQHSRKPDEARARIERFFIPGLRKIELFARESAPGWAVWGNETSKFAFGEQETKK